MGQSAWPSQRHKTKPHGHPPKPMEGYCAIRPAAKPGIGPKRRRGRISGEHDAVRALHRSSRHMPLVPVTRHQGRSDQCRGRKRSQHPEKTVTGTPKSIAFGRRMLSEALRTPSRYFHVSLLMPRVPNPIYNVQTPRLTAQALDRHAQHHFPTSLRIMPDVVHPVQEMASFAACQVRFPHASGGASCVRAHMRHRPLCL